MIKSIITISLLLIGINSYSQSMDKSRKRIKDMIEHHYDVDITWNDSAMILNNEMIIDPIIDDLKEETLKIIIFLADFNYVCTTPGKYCKKFRERPKDDTLTIRYETSIGTRIMIYEREEKKK